MRCAVFVGGTIGNYDAVAARVRSCDYFIAADSGARHAAALGLVPNLLIGDMDSLDSELLRALDDSGTSCRVYRPEKDETDGELAVSAAIEAGADEVLIFGIQGDRLDHFLGVLSLLKRLLDAGVPAVMVSENQDIWLVQGEAHLDLPIGSLISFIPFGDDAEGVTLKGFKYPLTEYAYTHGKPIGLSNVTEKAPATVAVRRGILVAIWTR